MVNGGVGVLVNPDDPTDALTLPRLPAQALRVAVQVFEVRDATKFDALAAALSRADV
jgi:hypothetical protein